MPLYDFLCGSCGHIFTELVPSDVTKFDCPHECGQTAERLPPLIGGYQGNTGSASTRPKNSGAMKRATVFTGNKDKE